MAKKSNGAIINPIFATGKTRLGDIDTSDTCGFKGDKDDAIAKLGELNDELAALQNVLFAEQKHKVLVVLQAMDTGGKDGAIRKVFTGINPQGVRIASFKAPTPEELAHDYLWRVHEEVPAKGEIVVFNRSHYEDVLITRVHGWIDDKTALKRFHQINEFERMLTETGTTILKFFLYISKDEQKARLEARIADPTKRWKFNIGDLGERKRWDDYLTVYQDAMRATSTKDAPWFVVPADRKWVRDITISSVLVNTLKGLKMKYPEPAEGLDTLVIE